MKRVQGAERTPPDRVKVLIEHAAGLIDSSPDHDSVAELLAGLDRLPPRELVRFDAQSRSWSSGLSSEAIADLRRPVLHGARKSAWEVLALVSADGHERERGLRATPFTPLTARLLTIRATDWVGPVRAAALDKLDDCPLPLLIEALPLADQLALERIRGEELHLLLDGRLSDEALRAAARAAGARGRRAALRRLVERGAAAADDLDAAARDRDVVVRLLAASAVGVLEPDEQRRLARVLVEDPVGAVATTALNVLVALDGAEVIHAALIGRSAGVRRAARDWAAIRDIDARAVYLERLRADRRDQVALTALAELGDKRDAGLFREMIGNGRVRVRAAGLRALGRADHAAARRLAVDALRAGVAGRMLWAAADVLRAQPPSAAEIDALVPIALSRERPVAQRLRALSLLRPSRWIHLATLLQARLDADDPAVRVRLDQEVNNWIAGSHRVGRGPTKDIRQQVEKLLPGLGEEQRRKIAFVLRTAV